METKDYLNLRVVVILLIVALLWGFDHPATEISNQGVSPIFASTLRSVVASICELIHCLRRGGEELTHSLMIGLPLVSAGIFLLNLRRRIASPK